jgi:hypothetical protein
MAVSDAIQKHRASIAALIWSIRVVLYSNLVANSYRGGRDTEAHSAHGVGPWLILAACVLLPVWLAVSMMALKLLGVWSY